MEEWHVSWPIKSNLIHPIMISFIKVSRLSSTLQARFTRRCLQREVTRGLYTHKQVRATFQCLVRKKKRLYLGKFEDHLYRLFLGQESKRAWKMFNERQPTTQLTSPQPSHEYAKVTIWYPGAASTFPPTWLTPIYWPSGPLSRRAKSIIRGFIVALWISKTPLTLSLILSLCNGWKPLVFI